MNFFSNLGHGWHNIANAHGLQITFIGLFLCFFSLSIIAIIIGLMPYLLKIINHYVPESDEHLSQNSGRKSSAIAGDDVVAAIGTALLYSIGTSEKE